MNQVIKVNSNRVWRTYKGGANIDHWMRQGACENGEYPELWVASDVKVNEKGDGMSTIQVEGSTPISFDEFIKQQAQQILGEKHYNQYGDRLGILVKMIDSIERLSIQVHPNKELARTLFNSAFGKTECWYILPNKLWTGEKPYILMGFKEGITEEIWRELFEQQDIEGMINWLHKIEVNPGEVYFIEAGVPHAIGQGCFLIEIQEPTDYTLRVERKNGRGEPIPDQLCHQGIGFDNIFKCFSYEGRSLEEMVTKYRIPPVVYHHLLHLSYHHK